MKDEIKAAEARGYSRGYQVGKRKNAITISAEQRQQKKDAFWQRAFLAAIPAAFAAEGWKRGDKPITVLADRMRLASEAADEAMKYAGEHL